MLFPERAAIGVPIKSFQHSANWPSHFKSLPALWPRLVRQGTPCFGAYHVCLDVCLFGISLLYVVPWGTSISVRTLPGLHGRRRTAQILKRSCFPVLVFHSIALKDNAPLVLTVLIALLELGSLLHTDAKQCSHVHLSALSSGLIGNLVPFADGSRVPNSFLNQLVPLGLYRLLRFLRLSNLGLSHRSCNTRSKAKQIFSTFVSVMLWSLSLKIRCWTDIVTKSRLISKALRQVHRWPVKLVISAPHLRHLFPKIFSITRQHSLCYYCRYRRL